MNQSTIRVVTELPTLNPAEFPQLPSLPDGKTLIVFSSPMQKAVKEYVLGFISTVAVRSGVWKPVSVKEFFSIVEEGAIPLVNQQEIINTVWQMQEEGLLELVHFDEEDYLVPSPQLAQMLTTSILRYA